MSTVLASLMVVLALIAAIRLRSSAGPARRQAHSGGVGHRQEPAISGHLLGAQRLGEPSPALRDPGRRPDRPPVSAGDSQHRLGRHRDRRPGTSLPGRHRQQHRRAAAPRDLSHRRARPGVARGQAAGRLGRDVLCLAQRRIGSTRRVCSSTEGPRSWWPSTSMVARPSCSPCRSIRRRPCSGRPGLDRSAGCPASPSPRRAPT